MGREKSIFRIYVLIGAAPLGLATFSNCIDTTETPGAMAPESDISVTMQAIGEAACGTAPPQISYSGGVVPALVSAGPGTGGSGGGGASGCVGTIVDVNNYSSTYLGPGSVPGGTYVTWFSPLSTPKACENAHIRTDLYLRSGSIWQLRKKKSSTGVWSPTTGCAVPRVGYTQPDLQAGQTYRFVQISTDIPGMVHWRLTSMESLPPQ